MITGLEVRYHLAMEPAKIRCRAYNEVISAETECYVNFAELRDFAERLRTVGSGDVKSASFGRPDPAHSFVSLELAVLDSRGHFLATIELASGDYEPYRSTATVRFESDRAPVDRFASELLLAISQGEGQAVLVGIR